MFLSVSIYPEHLDERGEVWSAAEIEKKKQQAETRRVQDNCKQRYVEKLDLNVEGKLLYSPVISFHKHKMKKEMPSLRI